MSSNRRMRGFRVFLAIGLLAGAAIAGTALFMKFWRAGDNALPLPDPDIQTFQAVPPPDLFSIYANSTDPDASRLLEGDFVIVKQMADIAPPCIGILRSSFHHSGSNAEQVPFADPGQDFEVSDVIIGGLPFRRLAFAGLGTKRCFVYYEHTGTYRSSCLAIMDYEQKKVVWLGEIHSSLPDLKAMRSSVSDGGFVTGERASC